MTTKKRKYHIDKSTYQNKTWIWDAPLEIYLSLFANRLEELNPNFKYSKTVKEILEKYVRKTKDGQVNATQIMRHAINKK